VLSLRLVGCLSEEAKGVGDVAKEGARRGVDATAALGDEEGAMTTAAGKRAWDEERMKVFAVQTWICAAPWCDREATHVVHVGRGWRTRRMALCRRCMPICRRRFA